MNEATIEEQIIHVSTSGTWATQVEVLATASVFEVPVFYCMQDSQEGYKWRVVKTVTRLMKFPDLPDVDYSITLLKPGHFELFYHENSHYDAVMSAATSKVCTDLPMLTEHCY